MPDNSSLLSRLRAAAGTSSDGIQKESSPLLQRLKSAAGESDSQDSQPKNKSAQTAAYGVDENTANSDLAWAHDIMGRMDTLAGAPSVNENIPNVVQFKGVSQNYKGNIEENRRDYVNIPGKVATVLPSSAEAPNNQSGINSLNKPGIITYNPAAGEKFRQQYNQAIDQSEISRAQKTVGDEINANAEYIRKDATNLISTAPTIVKDQLAKMGITPDFANKIGNENGDIDALRIYSKVKQADLKNKMDSELSQLEIEHPAVEQKAAFRSIQSGKPIRQNEEQYNQKKAEIQKKYAQQMDDFDNTAYNLAAIKSFNQEVQKGVDPSEISPRSVGLNIRYALGDGNVDIAAPSLNAMSPEEKFKTDLAGYKAIDLMSKKAFADKDLPLYDQLKEKSANYVQKALSDNPEYQKELREKALANEIYKETEAHINPLISAVAGHGLTKQDVIEAGKKLGWDESLYNDINPDDLKRWSGLIETIANTFLANTAGSAYELAYRHIYNPLAGNLSKGELNQKFGDNWYYNSWLGRQLRGQAPEAAGIITNGEQDTDPNSPTFLVNIANDNNPKWNIGITPLLNTIANGTGQSYAIFSGGEALGGLIKGIGIVNDAEKASRIGMNSYMWLTGWDRNYRQATEAVGDKPEDEAKRVLLATVYNGAEVGSENFIPEYQLWNKVKGTHAIEGFLKDIEQNGAKYFTKSNVVKTFAKAAAESGLKIAGEGAEEWATDYGQMVGDMMFAPDKFKNTNYNQQAQQDFVIGAISSFLPVGAGSAMEVANHGPMAKSMIYEVGKNPLHYTEEIRKKIDDGTLSHDEGNGKIKMINTLADIVNKSVPETSIVNNKDLSVKEKQDYTNLRLQEELLKSQKEQTKDPVQEKYIDERLKEIDNKKERILQTAGEVSYWEKEQPQSTEEPINPNNNGEINQADEAQGGQRRQEGNVLTAVPEEKSSPEVKQNQATSSGATSSVDLNEIINIDKEENPQHYATQETSQQQQEGLQPGGVSQRPGTESGQQEIGKGTGSERQAAQPEANNSNSDQRSEAQVEEVNQEHASLFKKLNNSRSQISVDKTLFQFGEDADRAKHISDNFDDILQRMQEASQNENVQFKTDCL